MFFWSIFMLLRFVMKIFTPHFSKIQLRYFHNFDILMTILGNWLLFILPNNFLFFNFLFVWRLYMTFKDF